MVGVAAMDALVHHEVITPVILEVLNALVRLDTTKGTLAQTLAIMYMLDRIHAMTAIMQ